MSTAECVATGHAYRLAAGIYASKQNPVCAHFCCLLLQLVHSIIHVSLKLAGRLRVHNADNFKLRGRHLVKCHLLRLYLGSLRSGKDMRPGSAAIQKRDQRQQSEHCSHG